MASLEARIESVRGPSSYSTGGFDRTLGEPEYIAESSGRMVVAYGASSSQHIPQVAGSSGNIVTIIMRDGRSSLIESAATTDFSGLHIGLVYAGL